MFEVAFNESEALQGPTLECFRETYNMFSSQNELLRWFRNNSVFFIDAPSWLRYLKRFDGVFGPRYHGVALGIQAEIPGFVIGIDSRTEEMCDSSCVKNIAVQDALSMSEDELLKEILWSDEDSFVFDKNRLDKAVGYSTFIVKNGLVPSPHMQSLASTDTTLIDQSLCITKPREDLYASL
jgi:hypothetical protein